MRPYHLLHKTELRIAPIWLRGADLTELAAVVADTLSLDREKVLVIDVRDETVAFDLLQDSIDAEKIVGKSQVLLQCLAAVPGVRVTAETRCSSDGMLGWIAWDEAEGRQALRRAEASAAQIRRHLSARAIVFSTGAEVLAGEIRDTNSPMIASRLEAVGYSVACGPPLADDVDLIFGQLRGAVEDDGYTLVITTGGTGAEDKDRTVEAVQALDPTAATPYICTYEKGVGRHQKDGVRVAVGQLGEALLVALPGPTDEVRATLEVLIAGVRARSEKRVLAESIAETLRAVLRARSAGQALHPPHGVSANGGAGRAGDDG